MSTKVADLFVAVGAKTDLSAAMKSLGALEKAGLQVGKAMARLGASAQPLAIGLTGGITAAVAAASKFNAAASLAADRAAGIGRAMASEVANLALPAFREMTAKLADVVAWLRSLSPEQKATIAHWVEMAAGIAVAVVGIGKFSKLAVDVFEVVKVIGLAFGAIPIAVLAVVAAVAAVALAVGALWKTVIQPNLGAIKEGFAKAWEFVSTTFKEYVYEPIAKLVGLLVDGLLSALSSLLGGLDRIAAAFGKNLGAKKALADLRESFAASGGFSGLATGIKDAVVYGLKTSVAGAEELFVDPLVGFVKNAMGNLPSFKAGAGASVGDPNDEAFALAQKAGFELVQLKDEFGEFSSAFVKVADSTITFAKTAQDALDAVAEEAGDKAGASRLADFGYGPGSTTKDSGLTQLANEAMKTIADNLRKVADEAKQRLEDTFINKLGELGNVINAAKEGFAAGGVFGALAAVGGELLTQSKQFQQLMDVVNGIVQAVADALGTFIEPLIPLVTIVGELVGVAFKPLGLVFIALKPLVEFLGQTVKALVPVFQLTGLVLGVVALAIGAVIDLFIGIGKLFALMLGDAGKKFIKMGEHYEVNLGEIGKAMGSVLEPIDFAAQGANNLGQSLQGVAEVLDGPSGFKVSLERWKAAQGDGPIVPAPPSGTGHDGGWSTPGTGGKGPGGGPTGHTYEPPDTDPRGKPTKGGGGDFAGTGVTHNWNVVIQGSDPKQVVDELERRTGSANLARTGTRLPLTKRFAG